MRTAHHTERSVCAPGDAPPAGVVGSDAAAQAPEPIASGEPAPPQAWATANGASGVPSSGSAAARDSQRDAALAAQASRRERMADLMAAIKAAAHAGAAELSDCIRTQGPRMDGHAVTAAVTRAARFAARAPVGGLGDGDGGSGSSSTAAASIASSSSASNMESSSGQQAHATTSGRGHAAASAGADPAALAGLRAEVAALLRARWRQLDGFGLCYCLWGVARLGVFGEERLVADMVGGARAESAGA